MQRLNRQQLEKRFEMYKPNAIYFSEAEIEGKNLKAKLTFPKTPIYLNSGSGIEHINSSEVQLIINQGIFLFYRDVILNGRLGLPKMSLEKMREYYEKMFIKQEIDYYKKFTSRNRKDLILTLEHTNTRKIGTAQLIWCNLEIPEFMHAEVIGGIQFE